MLAPEKNLIFSEKIVKMRTEKFKMKILKKNPKKIFKLDFKKEIQNGILE